MPKELVLIHLCVHARACYTTEMGKETMKSRIVFELQIYLSP
jgi:hypothetical protein